MSNTFTKMSVSGKRCIDLEDDRPSKKAKITATPLEIHPAWSVLIPRLEMASQMRLSMTCSALRRETAAYSEYRLRNLTKKLDADVNL